MSSSKVSIWIACLDQHGQIMAAADPERGRTEQVATHDVASSVQVAAHDPNNVIVHYWSVSLVGSHGLKNLLFQLSDLPQQTGMWTIRATAGGLTAAQSFRLVDVGHQHQSKSDPAKNLNQREDRVEDTSPMVESHFVELEFSPRTASMIEQGAPFAGEVNDLRIKLHLDDDLGSLMFLVVCHG